MHVITIFSSLVLILKFPNLVMQKKLAFGCLVFHKKCVPVYKALGIGVYKEEKNGKIDQFAQQIVTNEGTQAEEMIMEN